MKRFSKPHIVHIIISLDVGGVQSLVLGLATSLPLSECRHSVICLHRARGDFYDEYRAANILLHTCVIRWPSKVRLVPEWIQQWLRNLTERTFPWRMAFLLKRIKADVVHTHLPRSIDLIAYSSLEISQLPLVWSVHGENVIFYGTETEKIRKAIRKFINSGRGWITADSHFLALGLMQNFPEIEEVLRVVHAGADTKSFQREIPRDFVWRRSLGIQEDAIIFGSAGRLAYVKGYDLFIQAAALLLKQGINAHFVISGKGPAYDQLTDQIAQLGLDERFHLLGFQDDLPFIYKQFDVFVLSSRSEGFPLSLIEALAAGLPCIATDVSGVREMFGKSGGVIVQTESIQALLEGMLIMLNPEIRQKYAVKAFSIGQEFSFENCASQFSKLYFSDLQYEE